MRNALLALAVSLPIALGATGCHQFPEVDQTREQIEQLELIAEEAQVEAPDVAADARDAAAELRARLSETIAGESTRAVDGSLEAVQNGGLLALLAALGLMATRTKGKLAELRDEGRRLVDDLDRRRDQSRDLQGIAPAKAPSAVQTSSPAAKAAKRAQLDGVLEEALAE